MRIIIYTCLIFLLFTVTSLPQQQNFMPLEIGNEYQTYNGTNYFYAEILRDTVYPNGKIYYTLPGPIFEFGDTRVDETGDIFTTVIPFYGTTSSSDEYLIYKADARDGELWPVAWDLPVIDTLYAELLFTDTLLVFGQNRVIKAILLYENGIIPFVFWLADGIGQIRKYYDDGTIVHLNYAKINGVIYGNLVGIDDDDNINQLSFSVSQNYPNPFNPETKIDYVIKENGFVQLTVYNVLGQTVKELVNEIQSAGSHSVNFNAADLPSGVYIYKLKSGEYFSSKKMILLK